MGKGEGSASKPRDSLIHERHYDQREQLHHRAYPPSSTTQQRTPQQLLLVMLLVLLSFRPLGLLKAAWQSLLASPLLLNVLLLLLGLPQRLLTLGVLLLLLLWLSRLLLWLTLLLTNPTWTPLRPGPLPVKTVLI